MVECDPWIDLVATGYRFKVGHRRGKRYKISSSSAEDIPVFVVWFLICCSCSFCGQHVCSTSLAKWRIKTSPIHNLKYIDISKPQTSRSPVFSLQLSPTPGPNDAKKMGAQPVFNLGRVAVWHMVNHQAFKCLPFWTVNISDMKGR